MRRDSKTKDPTAAERNRRKREKMKAAGLVKIEEYVPANRSEELRAMAKKMRDDAV